MTERLSWNQVNFAYRGASRRALRDVSLAVHEGERVGLGGATGAGKSTLVRAANGTVPRFFRGPFSGEVRVGGQPIGSRSPASLAGLLGIVFQDFESQLFCTNARLECAFAMENLGVERAVMEERIARVSQQVGLASLLDREPQSLSGGQKQRLALASVLCLEPEVLLCDEPTTDLDPAGRVALMDALDSLTSQGRALVLVEHDAEQLLRMDRVLLLSQGAPSAWGPPGDVLSDPASCRRHGLSAPQLFHLFHRLGRPERPTTVDEAASLLQGWGWAPPPSAPEPAPGAVLFELEDLAFAWPGGPPVLQGISLTLREGEMVAILGQNGSGKTTLVKHLDALLAPSSGQVRFRGASVPALGTARMSRNVGFVFQNPDHMIFAPTVFDEVAFGLRNVGVGGQALKDAVGEALATVGLQDRLQEDPFVLTRGERQKLAVASVLALRPPVLVLDEPTTGLDANELEAMMDLLDRLHARGHTVVMVTHALDVAAARARRVVLVDQGRILADGPAREVFHRPDLLARTGLVAPPVVRLAGLLGQDALTVEELAGRALPPRGALP